MKISFISPAYQVENYLNDFFGSFETLKFEFEIIIINDDPTSDLSKWKLLFKNFNISIVNNKKNIGARKSRFEGLKYISKETTHVVFIDPDDRISMNFKDVIFPSVSTQFSYHEWYRNKRIYKKSIGTVSKYNLDNHLWGIIFPREIALQIPKFSYDDEVDDMPIKLRMAQHYRFEKSIISMIDYRVRKSSTINSKKTLNSALEHINTWKNLGEKDHLVSQKASINNQFFELIINKKSLDKSWYKSRYKELCEYASFSTKFNAHMYRLVSWWTLQNKLKSIFLNRKMFK